MKHNPTGILLAAGQSRRFGNNKLLQPLSNDTPILIASANNLCAGMADCLAIVNPETPPNIVKQLEQLGLKTIVNHDAASGIGSSIACGVRASFESSGWIFALADMPFIDPDTIRQLVDKLNERGGMVAPLFQQQRGHPVGFAGQYCEELLQLNGDVGARHIIAKHHTELTLIEVQDRGVISDIDIESDLRAAKQ
jgi:molybdenum cofactor cytidylyltransferase